MLSQTAYLLSLKCKRQRAVSNRGQLDDRSHSAHGLSSQLPIHALQGKLCKSVPRLVTDLSSWRINHFRRKFELGFSKHFSLVFSKEVGYRGNNRASINQLESSMNGGLQEKEKSCGMIFLIPLDREIRFADGFPRKRWFFACNGNRLHSFPDSIDSWNKFSLF